MNEPRYVHLLSISRTAIKVERGTAQSSPSGSLEYASDSKKVSRAAYPASEIGEASSLIDVKRTPITDAKISVPGVGAVFPSQWLGLG